MPGSARASLQAYISNLRRAMRDGSRAFQMAPADRPSTDPGRVARCYREDARYWLAALAERYDPAGVLQGGQSVRFQP